MDAVSEKQNLAMQPVGGPPPAFDEGPSSPYPPQQQQGGTYPPQQQQGGTPYPPQTKQPQVTKAPHTALLQQGQADPWAGQTWQPPPEYNEALSKASDQTGTPDAQLPPGYEEANLVFPEYTPYDAVPVVVNAQAQAQTVDSVLNSDAPFTPSPFSARIDTKGVCAYDDEIDTLEEMVDFMRTHNTRPYVYVHCWGGHRETRTRHTTESGGHSHRHTTESGGHSHTESYTVTVTDWRYDIDISALVSLRGYIQSGMPGFSAEESMKTYLGLQSSLKSYEMHKLIGCDLGALRSLCYGTLRNQWRFMLSVDIRIEMKRVKVMPNSCAQKCWGDCCGMCLCHLLIIPCIWFRCARVKIPGLVSVFPTRGAGPIWMTILPHLYPFNDGGCITIPDYVLPMAALAMPIMPAGY